MLTLLGLVSAIRLLRWYWPGSFFHNAASGTWTALAWDFAHGELYRPVLSPSGFGGTRYMPLMFMLHGLLIRLQIDPVHSGVLLMQATVVLASFALYLALRAAGVTRALALPFALTPWAGVTYQKFFTDMRADYLAAAFVVAGVAAACMASRDTRSRWLWCAGAACVLGTLTKFTAIVFVLPIACAFAAGGSRLRAVRFAAATLGVCVLMLGALQWASAGRLLENIDATMTAGMQLADFWRRGIPTFLAQLGGDPMIGAPFVLAVWSLVVAARRRGWSTPDSYFLTAAVITCVIYASPGTSSNHMIELQIATTVAVAVAVERGRLADRAVGAVYGVLVVIMIALALPLPGMPSPTRTLRLLGPHQRATVDAIAAEFFPRAAPYLSLNPMVPVLLHERSMVLDAFNLNLFVVENTAAGRDLRSRIHAQSFAAVVVDDDGLFARDLRPGDAGFADAAARFWAAATPVVQLIGSEYRICAVRRPFVILRPRDKPIL
ncbi:MAG TPA: hypothetical protein VLV86_22870 [Vicinamibacterales bacterium]|nr:hypothetical protein [Vicinamibacterales bacterium]